MSLCNIDHILIRIASAHPEHPIAVFRNVGDIYPRDRLYAVFGDTALTQLWIRRGTNRLIGVFDQTMDAFLIRRQLLNALENIPIPDHPQ